MRKQSIILLSIAALLVTVCGASAQAAPDQDQQIQPSEQIKSKQLIAESRFAKRTVSGRRDLDKVLILGGIEAFPM